ncbi:MAG: bifunctional demethylmenaquinone methyltransferase/2-methoxy-6-polyprenyl-1,4-benzoquinol methylase UbiE [Bryobacteraceae bacterium]
MKGTTPPGARTEQEAAAFVRRMFAGVARRYDLLNHLLSFQTDRYWRWRTALEVEPFLRRPQARVLDLCCGTGDLTLALEQRAAPGALVLGGDFCRPMLEEARRKLLRRGARIELLECDGLQLPFADGALDLVTIAFGFRNFANYRAALAELRRVIKPGGMLAILEFSTPPNPVLRALYRLYSETLLPALGGWISGDRNAYTYLPDSVRKFPGAELLAAEMEATGFTRVRFRRMTFGIVALHTGLSG